MILSPNRKTKEALKTVFAAPPPLRKKEFLQKTAPVPAKLSLFSFLLVQLRYIRKHVWILAALIFGFLFSVSFILSADRIWALSAFTPLLALLTVAETGRSEIYEMAELEMATRFSLRSVLLARLCILGLNNLFLLGLLFPVSLAGSHIPSLRAVLSAHLLRLPVYRPQTKGAGKHLSVRRCHSLYQLFHLRPPALRPAVSFGDAVHLLAVCRYLTGYRHLLSISQSDPTGGTDMELLIDRVSKQYKNRIAVDRVSLRLTEGVHGLLGENGAGKTTLMRMLCGILTPTGGTISFDGADVGEEAYRARLGYLPQDFGYYPEFRADDFLRYLSALKGIPKKQAKEKAAELLELVSLSDAAHKKIKTFSGGMKQRLGIAQALLNDPDLLILDEPTAGLDPGERVRFRDLIEQLGKHSIVLLSTHIVSDIEHIADQVLMMKDGQIIYQGKWDEKRGDLETFYLEQFKKQQSGMNREAQQ